ncbi:DnaA ATPase domain-containing protein [Streptomyces sp. NPDC101150]|uniref:DnaA ATPase domain-containing protein n=1 Tax=Streptomyces sp. NPDC101150 TaxID=3366114 RepID=UPI00382AF464
MAKTAPDHAYRFENFAAEAPNRFAHDVAVAVAEAPAQDYNPLLIHGAPGLGKTHLLHAVGHYACTLYPETRSQYVGCRQFVAFLRPARPGSAFGAFHRRFGTVDILLVDDVRWPAESGASQDLLAEVLAELLTADKQIVLASGPSLARMPHLEGGWVTAWSVAWTSVSKFPAPGPASRFSGRRRRRSGSMSPWTYWR